MATYQGRARRDARAGYGAGQRAWIQGIIGLVSCSAQVVLATNIAETSLTIEDVVYVVDTGKLKARAGPARTRPRSTLRSASKLFRALQSAALPCWTQGGCTELGTFGHGGSRGAARGGGAAATPAAA